MSFTNVYYKRATGTPRSCFICYKPTTVCLATVNTVDFLYSCESHLSDRGFAARAEEPAAVATVKPGLSAEEIAQVKADWETQQKKKERAAEKSKQAEAAKDGDKSKESSDTPSTEAAKPKSLTPATPSTPATPAPTTPTHEKYVLHRDIFALRQAEHKKRRQKTEAKSLAPRLPSAPTGAV